MPFAGLQHDENRRSTLFRFDAVAVAVSNLDLWIECRIAGPPEPKQSPHRALYLGSVCLLKRLNQTRTLRYSW